MGRTRNIPLRKRLLGSAIILPGVILQFLHQPILALPFLMAGTAYFFWLWRTTTKRTDG